MHRSSFLMALGCLLVPQVAKAGARFEWRKVPVVVQRYVAAWNRGDGKALATLFTSQGGHCDYLKVLMRGETLVAYVARYKGARFRVAFIGPLEGSKISVYWTVHWPGRKPGIPFRDELTLSADGEQLERAQSSYYEPSKEVAALLREYTEGWIHYDGKRSWATFAPGGKYYDPIKPDGVSDEELVAYIESLREYTMSPFFDVGVVKDGRVFARWTMRRTTTGEVVVEGYDLIDVQAGKVLTVHGSFMNQNEQPAK